MIYNKILSMKKDKNIILYNLLIDSTMIKSLTDRLSELYGKHDPGGIPTGGFEHDEYSDIPEIPEEVVEEVEVKIPEDEIMEHQELKD